MTSPASGIGASPHGNSESIHRLTVSIVICTRDRAPQLSECLAAVRRLATPPDDILVVDNSAGSAATQTAASEYGVRYVTEPAPGLSKARNRGLAECSSDIVAFIDDDALPSVQWLGFLLAPFADPAVAAVTGETLPYLPSGTSQSPAATRRVSSTDPLWFEIANFGGLGFGTNMALRRSFCQDPEFFDVRLGRGAPHWIAEESHAFTRLIARGYDAVHVPAAIVIHPDKPRDIQQEATTSFAYWLLLLMEFPGHRMDTLRFLYRRLRRKKLAWPRDPQGPGEIIQSGWRVHVKAGIAGTLLYFRARKLKPTDKRVVAPRTIAVRTH